ncbi:MAG: protein kinase [Sandaracinus sp.]
MRLGAYEIVSPLTSGGMAAVYLGRAVQDNRYVAIKVVHPHFANEQAFVEMFLDEARLSARIHHPNVVRVESSGYEGSLYYMVMEYLHGAPLQRFVRRLAEKQRALAQDVVVHLVAAVAAGLHAAHDATDESGRPLGIVHRDVTPQNILVTYAGQVKLIDFGIAKAAGRSHQTAKGMMKGKLRYMAPEHAAGRPVDRRTDVYSLGIVLWEMLTYRKAFSAKTDAELVRLVLSPNIVPPSRLQPTIPPALDAVAMKALAPRVEERFQTAAELQRALLTAVPAAGRVTEPALSSLAHSLLAEELAQDARVLPPSVVIQRPLAVGGGEDALTQVVPSLVPDEDDEVERAPKASLPSVPPAAPRAASMARTAYGIGLAPVPARPMAVDSIPATISPSFAPPPMPLPVPASAAPASSHVAPASPGYAAPAPGYAAPAPGYAAPAPGYAAPAPGYAAPAAPGHAAPASGHAPPHGLPEEWGAPRGTPSYSGPMPSAGAPAPSGSISGWGTPQDWGAPPGAQAAAPAVESTPRGPAAAFTPPNAIQRPVIPGAPRAVAAPAPATSRPPARSGLGVLGWIGIAGGVVLTLALGIAVGWLALQFLVTAR